MTENINYMRFCASDFVERRNVVSASEIQKKLDRALREAALGHAKIRLSWRIHSKTRWVGDHWAFYVVYKTKNSDLTTANLRFSTLQISIALGISIETVHQILENEQQLKMLGKPSITHISIHIMRITWHLLENSFEDPQSLDDFVSKCYAVNDECWNNEYLLRLLSNKKKIVFFQTRSKASSNTKIKSHKSKMCTFCHLHCQWRKLYCSALFQL